MELASAPAASSEYEGRERSQGQASLAGGVANESKATAPAPNAALEGLGYLSPKSRRRQSTPREAEVLRSLGYASGPSQGSPPVGRPSPQADEFFLGQGEAPGDLGRQLIEPREVQRGEETDEEAPNREGYRAIQENDFLDARANPLSTFAVDVDTASYANMRRILREGPHASAGCDPLGGVDQLLPLRRCAPRAEGAEHPIAVHVESARALPGRPEHRLVRVALTTQALKVAERKPSNLVFLLDVSGSMNQRGQAAALEARLQPCWCSQLDERDQRLHRRVRRRRGRRAAADLGARSRRHLERLGAPESRWFDQRWPRYPLGLRPGPPAVPRRGHQPRHPRHRRRLQRGRVRRRQPSAHDPGRGRHGRVPDHPGLRAGQPSGRQDGADREQRQRQLRLHRRAA